MRLTAAQKDRRQQVAERLSAHGLRAGPRRFGFGADPTWGDDFGRRLGVACAELGGGFAAFARYLGSRADLLPLADCRLLSAWPHTAAEAVPFAEIEEVLAADLGAPPGEIFVRFEQQPIAGDALHQVHRAFTRADRPVWVRVLRPGIEAVVDTDLGLLPLLRPAWTGAATLEQVIDDFRDALVQELDAEVAVRAFDELAREPLEAPPLMLPRPDPGRSARRVLTLEVPAGTPLGELDPSLPAVQDLPRRVALAWLQLVVSARRFPVDADLLLLADGGLGAARASLSAAGTAAPGRLWDYLRATADHDPEQVFACLCREIVEAAPAAGRSSLPELRRRLRQMVPRRQDALSSDGEGLADHLLLHARLVRQAGFQPQPVLRDFYRGVLWVARTTRDLHPPAEEAADLPGFDPLRDALEDQRWLLDWARMRQLGDPRRMMEMVEGYLRAASVLPQQLDRWLDQAPGTAAWPGGADRRVGERAAAGRGDTSATALSLAMVMAALVLLVRHFAPQDPSGRIEAAGALCFLFAGTLFLISAGRRR